MATSPRLVKGFFPRNTNCYFISNEIISKEACRVCSTAMLGHFPPYMFCLVPSSPSIIYNTGKIVEVTFTHSYIHTHIHSYKSYVHTLILSHSCMHNIYTISFRIWLHKSPVSVKWLVPTKGQLESTFNQFQVASSNE